jgi:hypothetical protein
MRSGTEETFLTPHSCFRDGQLPRMLKSWSMVSRCTGTIRPVGES